MLICDLVCSKINAPTLGLAILSTPSTTHAPQPDASRAFGIESGHLHTQGDQTFTVLERWALLTWIPGRSRSAWRFSKLSSSATFQENGFKNGFRERPSRGDKVGLRHSAAVLKNLPFQDPHAPPLHPYRGIRLLLGLIVASLPLP